MKAFEARILWLISRIKRRYYSPTRNWSRLVINGFLAARRFLSRTLLLSIGHSEEIKLPTAIYDLRICPNTFDFAYFLYEAETYFRERGFDNFRLFVLNVDAPHSDEYEQVVDALKRNDRVTNMLVPMAEMYLPCSSVEVVQDPNEIVVACKRSEPIFPPESDGKHRRTHSYKSIYRKMMQRIGFSGFKAPESAIEKVALFKKEHGIDGPCVTLTVRMYGYQPLRNTNMDVYFEFANYLRGKGYTPIFIPDAEAASAIDFRDFITFAEACSDICLRVAIYEASFTNVFTSNGVHALAAFNNNCSFMLALVNEAYPSNTGMKRWESEGLKMGDQPFGGELGWFIWEKESFENLKDHFDKIETIAQRRARAQFS